MRAHKRCPKRAPAQTPQTKRKCTKRCPRACFRFAGMFAGIFAGTLSHPFTTSAARTACRWCVFVCEGDLWVELVTSGCLRVMLRRTNPQNGSTGWYRFCCCLVWERKQNKVLASDTDKGPRHQTTGACCISWPNNVWGSVADWSGTPCDSRNPQIKMAKDGGSNGVGFENALLNP